MIDTTYSESVEPTVDISRNNPYPALRKIIKEEGLLDKAITYYIFKILSTLSLLAISITVLVLVDNFWFQLVNAAFLYNAYVLFFILWTPSLFQLKYIQQ